MTLYLVLLKHLSHFSHVLVHLRGGSDGVIVGVAETGRRGLPEGCIALRINCHWDVTVTFTFGGGVCFADPTLTKAETAWFIVRTDLVDGRTLLSARCRRIVDPPPVDATYMSQPLQAGVLYPEGVFGNLGVPHVEFPHVYGAVVPPTADDECDVLAISFSPERLGALAFRCRFPAEIRRLRVFALPPPGTNSGRVYAIPSMTGYEPEVYFTTYATINERQPLSEDVEFEEGVHNEDTAPDRDDYDVCEPPSSFCIQRTLADKIFNVPSRRSRPGKT